MEKAVKYGELAGSVALACIRRKGLIEDGCPSNRHIDVEEQRESAKELEVINRRLGQICNEQRKLEAAGGGGVIGLLGQDTPDSVRVAVNLMVVNGVVDSLRSYMVSVAELSELAAGRDVKGLLEVRESFSSNGVLRPHVNVSIGRHVGELEVPALKEKSLRVILNLPLAPASEFDAIEAGALAVGEFGKWRRLR